jgi:hypothetical protein
MLKRACITLLADKCAQLSREREFTDVSSSTFGQQILKWTRTASIIVKKAQRKKG